MTRVQKCELGGFFFAPGVFQYSAGVAAAPGYQIERARFHRPLPMAEGFAAIQAHLQRMGRPMAALCACELRSPKPFTEEGFTAFNREYAAPLQRWNLFEGALNPIARTNVCPEVDAPQAPAFFAFSYTVAAASAQALPSFVVAGSGEAPEGKDNYRDHVVRRGDCSPAGLREKARWVLGEMERRMADLGFDWSDATGTHLYTVHDVHPLLADEVLRRGAGSAGLTWHFSRPPVAELDYEMDVRCVHRELVL